MMIKQRCFHGGHFWFLTFTAVFLIFSTSLFAAEQAGYKIFSLKHISVEQGKKYLSGIITGTVTHISGTSALLVTPEPNKLTDAKYELSKAKAILDLVDGPEQYVVKAILPVSAARNLPSNEQLALKLTNSITRRVSIGSFSNPPNENAQTKSIIDIHNDQVIAIVPVRLLDRLVSAIGQSQNSSAIAAQNTPKSNYETESPAKRMVSTLVEPSEATFLFTASGSVKTDPNSDEAVIEQEAPKPPVDNQEDKDIKAPIDGEQVVDLALAQRQKLTVAEFLGMVGPYLGMTFMFDEEAVKDEVTINPHGKFRGPIKVKDLYPLLEEVLKFKSLAMTRGEGNFVTIARAENALDIDPALLETKEDKVGLGDGIVQRVVKLEHINTTTAQTFLDGMKLTTSITAIPETKTLILTGYARRMSRIDALLDIIDKPGEPKKFRFRQLQYTMAETLAPKIQSLAEQLGTISITIAATEAEPSTPSIPPRRANETQAQYDARRRVAEQQAARARAARTAATRTSPIGQQPEPTQPTVYLDADARTNRILMIGLDEQLDDVEELINTLDVVQQDLRSLEIYKVHHVDAEDVKRQLEELGIISPSLTSPYSPYSSRITTGAKPPTTPQTTAAAARPTTLSRAESEFGEAPMEEPQVIVVEPTNSLLVNATAEQHVKIAEILSYVDAETDQQEIRYKLYPLENQSPDHLAEILRPLIEERVLDKEGKVESVRQKQEELITIVPDPNTFSLIVNASKKNQEWIKSLVEQLDVRRPQVLMDVMLVEITETDVFDYDLQLVSKFPRFEADGTMSKAPAGNSALLSPFPSDRIAELSNTLGDGLIGGQGFYADSHIQALLSLMQQKKYGRVLAKPKILVNDNELGHIDATTTIYVSRSSSSATTAGEPVVSTSYAFDEFPSGIQLDITPHISKGNLLRLEIKMTRSKQTAKSAALNEPPEPKTENNIETTVTVPDQSTIILGGIIQLDHNKANWKVPLLGDIPLVGGLFRKVNNSGDDRRLYIFVKGEILRPDDTVAGLPDLEKISERNRIAFEESENKFQSFQDWPGIKPKPVEPLKVLDAQ